MSLGSVKESRKRSQGFTLVETLVALALAAVIASFLSGGVMFGRRAWEQSAERDEAMAVEGVRSMLKEDFERALPYRRNPNQGEVSFDGRADSLALVALSDPQVESGGLRQVRLTFVAAPSRPGELLYEASPLRGPKAVAPRDAAFHRQTLMRGVRSLSFRYFGSHVEGQPPQWLDEWRGSSRLPQAIWVRIEMEVNRGRNIELVAGLTDRNL